MSDGTREFRTPDAARVIEQVAERYGVRPAALVAVGHEVIPGRSVYRCEFANGRAWLLYVYAQQATMPTWLGGGSPRDWLRGRSALLTWLEHLGYPAPRVIPHRDVAALADHSDHYMLALSYIPGKLTFLSRDDLRQLGALLGWLHALPTDGTQSRPLPHSWWYPIEGALAPSLAGLDAVARNVPARWQALHASFRDDLRAVVKADLPTTLIHGDCHPGNAILTPEGSVTLIDWECAGMGAAVLDLGGLLTDGQPDPAPGAAIVVDPVGVAAVMEGYRSQRALTQVEHVALPLACRFTVAFQGAVRFLWACEGGWSDRIDRSLARLQVRYDAAKQAAVLAQDMF